MAWFRRKMRKKAYFKTEKGRAIRNAIKKRYLQNNPHAREAKREWKKRWFKTEKGKAGKQATMEKDLEFLNKHDAELKAFYNLYIRAMTAKLFLVKKLAQVKSLDSFLETGPNEYKVTPEEGKVIIDHMGNAVKLVDRLEFSRANFTMPKNWGGKTE